MIGNKNRRQDITMKINTFTAFKSRNYRLYFTGQSISLVGTWMQKTAVSWVVYALTHSKMMLGLSMFASLFPSFLLSSLGGVISDRYDRYKVLLATQVISMVQAVLLTLLIFSKHYNVWAVLALSAVLGIINAFDVPARQSLVIDMVADKNDLPNALALNSSMVNLSRLIGPGIAGVAIELLGNDICFALNALSFIPVIISILMMRLPKHQPKPREKNMLGELKEGFTYIKNNPEISFVLQTLAVMGLFVLPFITLMPVYARDIFHGSAATFGLIDSVIGLGAFIGALFLASLRRGRDLSKILMINTFILGAGLMLFSHTKYYPLALFFAMCSGFGMMSQTTISNTILQTRAHHHMRGRVIAVFAMALFGMQPLGGLLVGYASQHIGVENTVLAEGAIAILVSAVEAHRLRKQKAEARTVPIDKATELNKLTA